MAIREFVTYPKKKAKGSWSSSSSQFSVPKTRKFVTYPKKGRLRPSGGILSKALASRNKKSRLGGVM